MLEAVIMEGKRILISHLTGPSWICPGLSTSWISGQSGAFVSKQN
jgi:hypothetical protein